MNALTKRWQPTLYVIIGIILISLPFILPSYAVTLATSILIVSIFVGGVNLLAGYTGLMSIGHAMFWGSAAYVVGILTKRGIVESPYLAVLISLVTVTLLAVLVGPLVLRVSRLFFLIITFAFGHMTYAVAAFTLTGVTGGNDGIGGIPRPNLGLPWSLSNNTNFYFLVLAVFAACFVFLRLVISSPFGHALIGIRDNEHRMVALGYNTWLYKYVSYVLSAVISGVGGIVYVWYDGFINPNELHWLWSGDALIMMFIGGIGTFWGPVVGSFIFIMLRYWMSSWTMYWSTGMGIIFIVVVMFFRGGIVGSLIEAQRRMAWKR